MAAFVPTQTHSGAKGMASFRNEEERVHALVLELTNSSDREHTLSELSKIRESFESMALLLWNSFGVMTILLQEVVSIYPLLSQPTLNANASSRVCNALALMQCIASHPVTRPLFIEAQFPLYLYPILNTTTKTRPFEYLRLTSLGIIGALVKLDNPEVMAFLITTEIIPLCLRIMEDGNELCKTVAIFIVQKTLMDATGLEYICQTYERFLAVVNVLDSMTRQMHEQPSPRILKHVVRCYLRLCDNKKARDALIECLPESLRNGTFSAQIEEDPSIKRCLSTLLANLDLSPSS